MKSLKCAAAAVVFTLAFALCASAQETSLKDRIAEDVKGRRILNTDDETPEAERPVVRDSASFDPVTKEQLEVVFLKAENVAGALKYAAFYCPGRKVYWTFVWGGPRNVQVIHGPYDLRSVTPAMVETAIKKLITPEGNFGFYEGQFREIEAMGKGAVPILLDLFRDESKSRGIRTLSLEALGDLKDRSVVRALRELYTNEDFAAFRDSMVFTLAKLGDTQLADNLIQGLKRYIEDNKDDPEAAAEGYGQLAHYYARLEKQQEAIDCYKKAIELDPGNAAHHYYNMACALSVMKRIDEGIEALKKAIENGYEDFDWLSMDGDLDNIRKDPRFAKMLEDVKKKRK